MALGDGVHEGHPAWAMATTKHRSKKSSSGEATLWASSRPRAVSLRSGLRVGLDVMAQAHQMPTGNSLAPVHGAPG